MYQRTRARPGSEAGAQAGPRTRSPNNLGAASGSREPDLQRLRGRRSRAPLPCECSTLAPADRAGPNHPAPRSSSQRAAGPPGRARPHPPPAQAQHPGPPPAPAASRREAARARCAAGSGERAAPAQGSGRAGASAVEAAARRRVIAERKSNAGSSRPPLAQGRLTHRRRSPSRAPPPRPHHVCRPAGPERGAEDGGRTRAAPRPRPGPAPCSGPRRRLTPAPSGLVLPGDVAGASRRRSRAVVAPGRRPQPQRVAGFLWKGSVPAKG